ncbi:MAG: PfkB family carbohydrate kinase [bacterium]
MIKKVKILEFAPTADEIWRISKHTKDGYISYDPEIGTISILDTAHDAKPRPEIMAIYAGGKATNVARVLDRLLEADNDTEIELVTFLPPPADGPLQKLKPIEFDGVQILPSTPAGIYIQCLQISNLSKVRPHFEIIDELHEKDGMQTTRRCIEITLKDDMASMNFSPRIIWSQDAAKAVLSKVAQIVKSTNLIVIAGAPPVWHVGEDKSLTPNNFYSAINNLLDEKCELSIDARGNYIHECLTADKPPRFIFMNRDEFDEANKFWTELNGRKFGGSLFVHDKDGCWIWDGRFPYDEDTFLGADYLPAIKVSKVYSTIGAGDAMHAGFLKEWICSEQEYNGLSSQERLQRCIVYSQVVSAISVSNEKATYGIDALVVNNEFKKIWR